MITKDFFDEKRSAIDFARCAFHKQILAECSFSQSHEGPLVAVSERFGVLLVHQLMPRTPKQVLSHQLLHRVQVKVKRVVSTRVLACRLDPHGLREDTPDALVNDAPQFFSLFLLGGVVKT